MAQFPITHWSLIRRSGETPSQRHAAFGQLAQDYRKAILVFFRARIAAADAEDATQSFLAASFEQAWWSRANAETGSFRGFLLMLLHRHLGHLRAKAIWITDAAVAIDAIADQSPSAESQFDTRFALVLTQQAIKTLRLRYIERARGDLFERLLPLLGARPEHGELKQIADSMQLPPNTLTIELTRLRKRLREQLRAELMELCADETTLEAEWTALQQVLSGK